MRNKHQNYLNGLWLSGQQWKCINMPLIQSSTDRVVQISASFSLARLLSETDVLILLQLWFSGNKPVSKWTAGQRVNRSLLGNTIDLLLPNSLFTSGLSGSPICVQKMYTNHIRKCILGTCFISFPTSTPPIFPGNYCTFLFPVEVSLFVPLLFLESSSSNILMSLMSLTSLSSASCVVCPLFQVPMVDWRSGLICWVANGRHFTVLLSHTACYLLTRWPKHKS